MIYDQDALDAASREVHMMLLREGSSWGTKACEEMGRIFMTAYLKAAPRPEGRTILPLEVYMALMVMLNHVEPGWDNCRTVVKHWYDQLPRPPVSQSSPQSQRGNE